MTVVIVDYCTVAVSKRLMTSVSLWNERSEWSNARVISLTYACGFVERVEQRTSHFAYLTTLYSTLFYYILVR